MAANERDSRVTLVYGYFSEGGDSVLTAFSCEAARQLAKEFLGCVSARIHCYSRPRKILYFSLNKLSYKLELKSTIIIILILDLSVSPSVTGRSTEAIRPEL